LGLSLGIAAEGSRSSTQEPETGSRRLYAGRRLARKQASSGGTADIRDSNASVVDHRVMLNSKTGVARS
jgi:hypothetical protein